LEGSTQRPEREAVVTDNDPANSDPFEGIAHSVIMTVEKRGGKVDFQELQKWADATEVGKYTLRTVVNDLIDHGRLNAPDGFLDGDDDFEPPIPKVVELPRIAECDIKAMKRYLSEYWSVGELRLFEDMVRLGMKEINEVLKAITDSGYAVLTPFSVINATEKLLRESR
jgi:hypothetical protein